MIEEGKYWRFDVHIWWSHSISYAVEEPLIYWSSFQIIIELSLAVSTVPLALKHFQREKKKNNARFEMLQVQRYSNS